MVVVDSSVIIHFARIGKLHLLENYFKKIKITQSIEQEIIKEGKEGTEEIRRCIGKWIEVKKMEINKKSEVLSTVDLELIELAENKKDLILTNDEEIILFSRARNIETMWVTTFIITCIKKKLIDKKEAKQLMDSLIMSGMYLRTDTYATVQKIIDEM